MRNIASASGSGVFDKDAAKLQQLLDRTRRPVRVPHLDPTGEVPNLFDDRLSPATMSHGLMTPPEFKPSRSFRFGRSPASKLIKRGCSVSFPPDPVYPHGGKYLSRSAQSDIVIRHCTPALEEQFAHLRDAERVCTNPSNTVRSHQRFRDGVATSRQATLNICGSSPRSSNASSTDPILVKETLAAATKTFSTDKINNPPTFEERKSKGASFRKHHQRQEPQESDTRALKNEDPVMRKKEPNIRADNAEARISTITLDVQNVDYGFDTATVVNKIAPA